jgi:hypothetical protein
MLLSTRDAISRASTRLGKFLRPGGRLTLDPTRLVTTDDITSATTIYYLAQDDGVVWLPVFNATSGVINFAPYEFSSLTIPLGTLVAQTNYDIFLYDANGVLAAKIGPAWATATSRGTGVGTTEIQQNLGVWVNAQDIVLGPSARKGLLVGTFRTISTTQTADMGGGTATQIGARRFIDNVYNREPGALLVRDTAVWNYGSATIRPANGAAFPGNAMEFVNALPGGFLSAHLQVLWDGSSNVNIGATAGFGLDATTNYSYGVQGVIGAQGYNVNAGPIHVMLSATYQGYPGLGYHYLSWNETGADGNSRFIGSDGVNLYSGADAWKLR